ncbi:MAG: histidine phosphatase family protein, partial [Tistlia sp.]
PGLTEDGRRQAAAAGRALSRAGIRRLLVSPYRRTLETAAELLHTLDAEVEIAVEPLVRERAFFVCDVGSPRSELERGWPHLDFGELPERWWPEGEEPESEMLLRCQAFRRRMAERDDWTHTLVVSHWAFIKGLTGQAVGNCERLRFDPLEGPAQAPVQGPAEPASKPQVDGPGC